VRLYWPTDSAPCGASLLIPARVSRPRESHDPPTSSSSVAASCFGAPLRRVKPFLVPRMDLSTPQDGASDQTTISLEIAGLPPLAPTDYGCLRRGIRGIPFLSESRPPGYRRGMRAYIRQGSRGSHHPATRVAHDSVCPPSVSRGASRGRESWPI